MKTSKSEKLCSGAITIKFDALERSLISSLASAKKRTPQYLMKKAILEHIKNEQVRQNFMKAAESSLEHYKETGLHITLGEFSNWVDQIQNNPNVSLTKCHK